MSSKKNRTTERQRPILRIIGFDPEDRESYDGRETCRGLNKFQKKWFYENDVMIAAVSKSLQGKTFVVPYVDREGTRYWIFDEKKREKRVLKGMYP